MSELHQPAVPVSVESLAKMGEKIARLERERDEARKNLAVSRDIVRNQREFIAQLNEEAGKITIERDSLRARVAELEGSRWEAVHSGGHWWIADEKTGDLIEMIAGPEFEIAEAIANAHNFSITGKESA